MSISAIGSNSNIYDPYSVQAQNNQTQATTNNWQVPSIDDMVTRLTSNLGLSDSQAAQIKQILQNNLSGMTSDNSANSGVSSQLSQMQQDIMKVLNPDQQKVFQQMTTQRHHGGHHHHKSSVDAVNSTTNQNATNTSTTSDTPVTANTDANNITNPLAGINGVLV